MRVTFTENAELRDAAGQVVESYLAGESYDLRKDKCLRWIRRGKAAWGVAEKATAPFAIARAEFVTVKTWGSGGGNSGDETMQIVAGGGPSPDSGPEAPSSASPVDPASPETTASVSDTSDASQSTEAGNSATTQKSSTEPTPNGGAQRRRRGRPRKA